MSSVTTNSPRGPLRLPSSTNTPAADSMETCSTLIGSNLLHLLQVLSNRSECCVVLFSGSVCSAYCNNTHRQDEPVKAPH